MESGAETIAGRLERIAPNPAMWRRVALISLGGFFEFYDMFLSGYIAPGLVRAHILTPTTPGLFGASGIAGFVAALFMGLFLGTALFGFVADRFGRRVIFTTSLLWYMAASAAMAFQSTAYSLDLWRFIAGVGIGVELVTIDTYIAELVPAGVRGRAFALNQVIQFSAVPFVALLAWLLVPRSIYGLDGWRWVVLLGSFGAGAIWWLRLSVPESPRWLASHGRLGEADGIVSRFEQEAGIIAGVKPEPLQDLDAALVGSSIFEIFGPAFRVRTAMLVIFNIFQTVGYYGFSNWVPTLLIAQGIGVTTSLKYTFVIATAAPLGPLLSYYLSDCIERKWLIVAASLCVAGSGLLFAAMGSALGLILFGVLVTLANNTLSFSFHAYQAELYPTRIRALAVGFVYSFSRLSTVFSAFVIAFVLGRFGAGGVFTLIAGSMVIVAIDIGILGAKTRGRALEEIAR